MGYNCYDSYQSYLDQETAKRLMDIMAEKYLPYGYEYFIIDGGWYREPEIDQKTKLPIQTPHTAKLVLNHYKYGLPEPSKVNYPNGFKSLADYAHSIAKD